MTAYSWENTHCLNEYMRNKSIEVLAPSSNTLQKLVYNLKTVTFESSFTHVKIIGWSGSEKSKIIEDWMCLSRKDAFMRKVYFWGSYASALLL